MACHHEGVVHHIAALFTKGKSKEKTPFLCHWFFTKVKNFSLYREEGNAELRRSVDESHAAVAAKESERAAAVQAVAEQAPLVDALEAELASLRTQVDNTLICLPAFGCSATYPAVHTEVERLDRAIERAECLIMGCRLGWV